VVRQEPRSQTGQPRFQALTRPDFGVRPARDAPERPDDSVDLAIAMELATARAAGADVMLDSSRRGRLGVIAVAPCRLISMDACRRLRRAGARGR